MNPDPPFVWHTYDVRARLPERWRDDLVDMARSKAQTKTLTGGSVTSREDSDVEGLEVSTVGGELLRGLAPWLFGLYEHQIRELAQRVTGEPVVVATQDNNAVNLSVQRGCSMRGKAHVDLNPVQGLLYVTSHPKGSGGELVVAQREQARGVKQIDESGALIYPVAGHLVFFDARRHPHYVRPLTDEDNIRVVVTMDFYTPSCTESTRPPDLDA